MTAAARNSAYVKPATTLIALVVLASAAPAPADAARCEGPPGLSAIEQYCETVPSAGGDRSPLGGGGGGSLGGGAGGGSSSGSLGGGAGGGSSSGSATDPIFSPGGVSTTVLKDLRRSGRPGRALAERLKAGRSRPRVARRAPRTEGPSVKGEVKASGGLVHGLVAALGSGGLVPVAVAVLLGLAGLGLIVVGVRRKAAAEDTGGTESGTRD